MKEGRCCLCGRGVDAESASILMMSGFGNPRYLCPECDKNLNGALTHRSYEEIAECCRALSDAMIAGDVQDGAILKKMNELMSEAKERAVAIKEGRYDFSAEDEESEEIGENDEKDGVTEEITDGENYADEDDSDAPTEEDKPLFDISDIPEELRESEEDRLLDEKEAKAFRKWDRILTWGAGSIIVIAFVYFLIKFIF